MRIAKTIKNTLYLIALLVLGAGCADGEGPSGGFEPFTPPATDHPYIDLPCLQEFNHTSNEL